MHILMLSPLFPPDTGDPAEYVKELSKRLAPHHHVTTLIYGHLPEAVSNVTIISVDKRSSIPVRLLLFSRALFEHAKNADVVIVQNAPSTEVPALLLSFILKKKMVLCESDTLAEKASRQGWYKIVHTLLLKRSLKRITLPEGAVYKKPEILPFSTVDEAHHLQREEWWKSHVTELTSL